MKLHAYWRSSTSYRVRIALNLKGLAYEIATVNLVAGEHRSANYRALNPAGTVPTLEWSGRIHAQSLAIFDLLEERVPTPSLWPADPDARGFCRELVCAIATETHAPTNMRALAWLRQRLNADETQIRDWYADAMYATLEPLETRLAALPIPEDAPAFGAPGAFEAMLVPLLYNCRRFGMNLESYPTLIRLDALCGALDAFKRAAPDAQPDAPT